MLGAGLLEMRLAAWFRTNAFNIAAFVWGVAEATLFFIVPDVLLSFVGARRGARAGALAAMWAALGACVGGALMFTWSAGAASAARAAVLAVPAISAEAVQAAHAAMGDEGWFLATLAGPLTSTPFKIYALLAPQLGVPLALFAPAAFVIRLPRFLIAGAGGALLRLWFEPGLGVRRLMWALAAGWVFFYAVFFALTPS